MDAAVEKLRCVETATQEIKRGGVGPWSILLMLAVRNWFVSWAFFLPGFILNLVRVITSAITYYIMGQMVSTGAAPHIAEFGLTYGAYIVTGVMFIMVMDATLEAYHEALLRGYWTNQFDLFLQHPGGISALLAGEVVAKYLVAGLNTVIYFLVAIWLFKIPVVTPNVADTLVILIVSMLSLTGLGLAGASTFSLLNAKRHEPNPVVLILGFLVVLVSGVYFPPSILPGWMQGLSDWLPQTHALRAARLCLSGKASLGDPLIMSHLTFLLKFAAVTLPLGLLLFLKGIKKAQRDGSLTRWS